MSILQSVRNWLSPETAGGLVCPRCERSMEGHDEAACQSRMSRRYFFGVAAGGVVLAAMAKPLFDSGVAIARAGYPHPFDLNMEQFFEDYVVPRLFVVEREMQCEILSAYGNIATIRKTYQVRPLEPKKNPGWILSGGM